ncbi:MAG: trypsin-like peptidase domain-containing protein [Deltaproteobacteria bacterium]|nr:trypsin-like peptidase domain-containing protein [Deltaproteobacteria bacterium]
MTRTVLAAAFVAFPVLVGCGHARPADVQAPGAAASTTQACAAIGPSVLRFGETLEDVSEGGKARRGSYAGVLEMLLTFERASSDLEAQLAATKADDAAMQKTLEKGVAALAQATEFAKGEQARIEKASQQLGPAVKEADGAMADLVAACGAKRPPRECTVVTAQVAKAEGSFRERLEAIEELAGTKMTNPAVARARDRVVTSTRALAKSIEVQASEMKGLAQRWSTVEKSVTAAFDDVGTRCKDVPVDMAGRIVADAKPDPRKLTVLVRVKPPAGIDDTFEELAMKSSDPDEKAFYEARAKGAFGSGFVVVRTMPNGSTETLVITNRHVVELADRAALELADGTALGPADILYTDATHDVAVLRPAKKLPFDKGFAFSSVAAKDQQGVIATGFPGMAGRPSYQTTRGYVSNESFKLEESARPMTYVQHTAPIDPGSSGGPLTDERGNVLGVNTLKVTNREGVGLAVPAPSILEVIRRADLADAKKADAPFRRETARLACLAFVGELSTKKPRLTLLENMISNQMTGAEGLVAAMGIDDESFGQIWQADTVRALRIATLLRMQAAVSSAGGTSPLETCSDVNQDDARDIVSADEVRYRVRLANWDTREVAFRWEQGHWKLGRMDLRFAKSGPAKPAKPVTPPKPAAPKKKK